MATRSSSSATQKRSLVRWGIAIVAALIVAITQGNWGVLLKTAVTGDMPKISQTQSSKDSSGFSNQNNNVVIPANGGYEVAFSPNEGSLQLVLKIIDSSKKEISLMAYSFTSKPIVEALLRAQKRGVKVSLIVDEDNNVNSKYGRAALSSLVVAGIDVRIIGKYAIHHDKVIISDRESVQLGSFNYSEAAAKSNSENVLVVWKNPSLAETYLKHFQRNWTQGTEFKL